MIPDAAQAVIHSAVWDAGQLTDPHTADTVAQCVVHALEEQGWMITAELRENGHQKAA
ncbi:hypothetical protein ACFZB5_33540 [Streptomyces nodosus]|uniref:hypothetical protein n=1 Tax=Streptomyces nodosus TaxID=40318 RepID=UPI0036E11094